MEEDKGYETIEQLSELAAKQKKQVPFDAGIKTFKKFLREQGVPKAAYNKAVKEYKERVYNQVEEIKDKINARKQSKK